LLLLLEDSTNARHFLAKLKLPQPQPQITQTPNHPTPRGISCPHTRR
jgi:hypothetical protein